MPVLRIEIDEEMKQMIDNEIDHHAVESFTPFIETPAGDLVARPITNTVRAQFVLENLRGYFNL